MSTTDRYDKMTQDQFDSILADIVGGMSGAAVLAVSGVYEQMAEHFNNEVLERWEQENTDLVFGEDAPKVGDLVFNPGHQGVALQSPWGTVEAVNGREGIQTYSVEVNGDAVSVEFYDSAWHLTDEYEKNTGRVLPALGSDDDTAT